MSRGVDVTNSVAVSSWEVLAGWCELVHDLRCGPVRRDDWHDDRELYGSVSRWPVWRLKWLDNVELQRVVHCGLFVSRRFNVTHSVVVPIRPVLAGWCGLVYKLQCGLVWCHDRADDSELQWVVHRGICLRCRLNVPDSIVVSCRPVLAGWCGVVHDLCCGPVRRDDWLDDSELYGSVSRWPVRQHDRSDDVELQRVVHCGLRVPRWIDVVNSVVVSRWEIFAVWINNVRELQCGSVRQHDRANDSEL